MNWKWGTAFGILAFVTLVSIVFAFVQLTVANETMRMAESSRVEAEEQRGAVEEARRMADASQAEAQRQQFLYVECLRELTACQAKSK